RAVLPDLAIDRAEAVGHALQAGNAARHCGLAAAGRAEDCGDAGDGQAELGIEREIAEPAAEGCIDPAGFDRSHPLRLPALLSITVMGRITANAKITMRPRRMLASRQRDVST